MKCSETSSKTPKVDANMALYNELWRACAGPLVTLPRENELVFYFPQGHIEEVEASINRVADKQMSQHDLPSKILCRVVSVQLKAERDTDEVFAQITLMPESNKNENAVKKEDVLALHQQFHVCSFSKTLTASDTSTHARLVVPKKHADECFPQLDMSRKRLTQDLVAKDLHGNEWRFSHIFRGRPQRHLLQSGWSVFVGSKRLVSGDAFIFVRGENGELGVGVRRARRHPSSVKLHHGVLKTAWHSIQSGTLFSVDYYPRTSPAEFILPFDQYVESINNNYSVGMRFNMRFEGGEATELRCTGTIVGIEEFDPKRWPESKWRNLKVQWDENLTVPLTDRVSPWKIQPATTPLPLHRQKRHRSNISPQSPLSSKEDDQRAKPSKGFKDMDNNSQGVSTKSPRIKVHKQGSVVGRSLDLTKFNNYDELIAELDELFEFHGDLTNHNKDWVIVYTDIEGDMMLVGDDPWQVFCGVVCKILIYTKDEVQRMNASTLNSKGKGKGNSSIVECMDGNDTLAIVLYRGK